MSVFLQSLRTEKFVAGPSEWTVSARKARKFAGGTEAVIFCYRHHLADMQVLGRFADRRKNFTIPLDAGRTE